jgi:membrane protease subunit (stomatin/prohibitin family)
MWGSVKQQLRSVIQWTNPSTEAVLEQWSGSGDEIKNASKLIVGPGQGCIFVYEGRIQGVFTEPGIFDLRTANIPFWTTVTKFMQGFVSEHKVGLYFFKTTQIVDQKWGTPSVIKYEDPKYHFPVGLRVYGNFSVQIKNIDWFFTQIVGTDELYTATEMRELFTSRIIQPMTNVFANAKFTYTEIDSHRNELSLSIAQALNFDFDKLGFQLVDFRIEGTSFDDDTMKRINRIADMSAESQAAGAAGVSYAQLQQLQALRDAAKNPGGAGMVMGLGVGVGLGNQLQGAAGFGGGGAGAGPGEEPAVRLKKLADLLAAGLITQDEFDAKKKDILSKI